MKRQLAVIMPLVFVVVVAAACRGAYEAPKATPTPVPAGKPGEVVMEVALTARYASFQPSTITVAKGQTIRLKVTSLDVAHTFTVDALGVNIAIGGRQTVVSEIMVEKAGTFTFYCAVRGHREAGMAGTLRGTE